jgi:glycosyltransferase involved in cell wall biosynthesis
MQPDVSVVVPVYNVEHYFERCLRSLFEQSMNNIEYIFVNDCTPDNCMVLLDAIIKEYPERKDYVHIIHHLHNTGLGKTREDGMKAAKGQYVISCDSDDWVETDMYEKMYKKAIDENADIVCCEYFLEYPKKTIRKTYPYDEDNSEKIKNLYIEGGVYSALWNKLVKRELYTRNNAYSFADVNMWEDLGVTIRLRYFSRKTVIIHQAFYHYNQQNGSSISSLAPKLSAIEEQIRCANCIEKFFEEQGIWKDFFLAVSCLKFMSKGALLFNSNEQALDDRRWKNTFPETHKYILKYRNIPLIKRIAYWLAANGFARSICFLVRWGLKFKHSLA